MLTDYSKTAEAPFRISVIIPTYNAGSDLQQLLRKLWKQTAKPYEIIVVDSSSQDQSAQLAEQEGARVLTILQSEFDHGGTRNFAAGMAQGDVLVFMTQDAIPANERLLEELTAPLYIEETGCVYARQLARDGAAVLERLARLHNYPDVSQVKTQSDLPQQGLKTFFCSNVCSAVRREVFLDNGRFPEPVIFNEDMFFAASCILKGQHVVYAAEAQVIHSHDYTLKQQFKRFFDNGVSLRRHDWIYEYSAVGGEGFKMIRMMLKGLLREGKWYLIPRLVADSAAKLLGYQLGKRYDKLPKGLCRRFSMHRKIWGKLEAAPSSHSVTDRGINQ